LRSIEVTLRNNPADISVIRSALDRFGAEERIPGKVLIEMQVVLDEIVSNVIKYAWPGGGSHDFLVRLSIDHTTVGVEVIDDGQAYDPRDAPMPAPASSSRRPPPGGLGIHLIKQLVDFLEYERIDEHNRVSLKKRFVAAALPQNGASDGKRRA
jgi:anti-sigma regulatory factor (Ser/Thr protein kinase)